MNRRSSIVAGLVAVAALAACGSDADDLSRNARPPVTSVGLSPSQVYYELTHPEPSAPAEHDEHPSGLRSTPLSPFEVYYQLTHP